MMDVTKETMTQHFQAYDKFKDEITDISSQADEAIKVLKYYDDEKEADEENRRVATATAAVTTRSP